ncbi:LuxR C-terminal-related transcriptional regulator [Marinobacter fonticola]|uniref:LuxR C-terminal-related transcriptional regulator n=1 Tax=Marinobacter fonticola TaxID=2603215 RepID=UPI00143D88FD|nr:LuxR C-terminal-related transcriptional regulator [Marinobacter fonticola]
MVTLAARQPLTGDGYLQHLAGHVQQVQEYMFEEVIKGLQPDTLHYLLCSALPQRFSAALLDAMALTKPGLAGVICGEAFVRFAEHNNMFTLCLDAEGEWYRYHNLFRELLVQRAHRTFSAESRRNIVGEAAAWLEAVGEIDDAIRILLEHDDSDQAAHIIDRHRNAALDADHWLVLQSWLQKFSPSQTDRSPVLLLTKASLATFNLDLYLLGALVQQLDAHQSAGNLSDEQLAELSFFRALPLFWSGDIAAARVCLERAARPPLRFGQLAGELYIYLSMSLTMTGDQPLALKALSEADEQNAGRRNIFLTRLVAAKSFVGYVALQSPESLAQAEYLAALTAIDVPSQHARGWGHYMRTLNLLNTGRLDTARQAANEALRWSDYLEKRVQIDLFLVLGICHCRLGHDAGVSEALVELETLMEASPNPELRVTALSARVRLILLRGNVRAAQTQALELPQTPMAGTLAFWLEEPCLTSAKVQLAMGNEELAQWVLPLLDSLYRQACVQHLKPWQVEIRLMQAVAEYLLGRLDAAQQLLRGAVELAHPHHWIGPFAELAGGIPRPLVDALQRDEHRAFVLEALASRGSMVVEPGRMGPDQFTNRELDVLQLLAARRRNKEIATTLFISANTVNFHLKHIYQKLDVTGRRQAVVRATALGLLSPYSLSK